jgi:hypothetical protein
MRLPWLMVFGAIGVAATSFATAADSFTVGVLSCAAETDRDRRLECYDRAVAGYTAGLAGGRRDAVAGVAPSGVNSAGVAASRSTPVPATGSVVPTPATGKPAVAGSAPGLAATGTTSVVSSAATGAPSGVDSAAAVAAAAAGNSAGTAVPRHVAARISSVEHFPDYVVVHLDNQQTWKQVSDSPGAPVLRNGDPVTIDRQVGSYWLAGPKGEAIQVRLEVPKP